MKKIILIIFASLIFVSLSYAGGDDRDQVLPLNSLNDGVDETPTFLQDNDSEEILSDEYKAEELGLSNQIDALANKLNIKDEVEVNIKSKASNSFMDTKSKASNSFIDIKSKASNSFMDIKSKASNSFMDIKSKAKSFINKYLKSEQGILVAAIVIIIGFIVLLSFI